METKKGKAKRPVDDFRGGTCDGPSRSVTGDLTALRNYLASLQPGSIADIAEVARLLAACWDDLVGDEGAMAAYKLLNRKMENVTWKPPILSFAIERHGAAALGSTRAELQHWHIDVKRKAKTLFGLGRRQLTPRQKSLDVEPLAEEIAKLILAHAEDDRLRWYSP